MIVKILVICGQQRMTSFMQACDVFDKGKVVGEIKEVSITFEEDIDFERAEKVLPVLKSAIESEGTYKVHLLHIEALESKDNILKNNKKSLPYYNPEVRQISDGSKNFLFCNFLKILGYNVETTQDMYIKTVTL